MSCCKLKEVKKRSLEIEDHDLLDGTPILDIKPYLPYSDAFPNAKEGWTKGLTREQYSLNPSEEVEEQLLWLKERGLNLLVHIKELICLLPYPKKGHRVKELKEGLYQAAVLTWRVDYVVEEKSKKIELLKLYSGYDEESLQGLKESRWDDLPLHREFVNRNELSC